MKSVAFSLFVLKLKSSVCLLYLQHSSIHTSLFLSSTRPLSPLRQLAVSHCHAQPYLISFSFISSSLGNSPRLNFRSHSTPNLGKTAQGAGALGTLQLQKQTSQQVRYSGTPWSKAGPTGSSIEAHVCKSLCPCFSYSFKISILGIFYHVHNRVYYYMNILYRFLKIPIWAACGMHPKQDFTVGCSDGCKDFGVLSFQHGVGG